MFGNGTSNGTTVGQDDLVWHQGTKGTINGSTAYYYDVEKSEHLNESGEYITHIYYNGQTSRYYIGGFTVTVN